MHNYKEISSLISTFVKCSRDLNEEKVKNLLITPLLTYCYLDAGKSWEDIWDSFYFGKEGEGEADIKIRTSENSFVLVEVKRKEKEKGILKSVSGKSSKVCPKVNSEEITLKLSVKKPSILLLENSQGSKSFYNLDGDILGQVMRYVLQTFLENQNQKREVDINLILTNGNEWEFLTFDKTRLRKIYDSLKNSKQKIKSENDKYVFNVLDLSSTLNYMEEISLQKLLEENKEENKLAYFFEKLKSYLNLR